MKKRAELLQAINDARKNVLALLQSGKVDEAKKASDELDALQKEFDAMPSEPMKGVNKMQSKQERKVALNHAIATMLRKGYNSLNDEEKKLVKPLNTIDSPGNVESDTQARGGVLVPVQTADIIKEMSMGAYRLKDKCDYFPTNTRSGVVPAGVNPESGLIEFDELPVGGLPQGEAVFKPIAYTVKNRGELIKVSNEMLADASADVLGYIFRYFGKKQIIGENLKILAALDSLGTAEAVTDWKGILKALNVSVPIGAIDSSVIVTNQTGWNYLDSLTSEDGKPLLTLSLIDGAKWVFRGYEVIVISNKYLPDDKTDGTPFYCGSLFDAILFVEREGLEMAVSDQFSFGQYATAVRCVTRFDVEPKFADAMKKVTMVIE